MKRICLVTHPQASHSVEGRVGGWFDSELTDKGREDSESLRIKITAQGFDLQNLNVFSSDLKRCTQTTEIILEHSNVVPKFDARLREMSFGTHGGIDQNEHDSIMIPVPFSGSRLDHRICEGSESRRELAHRVQSIVEEIMKSDGECLVVTHGFAATFFIAAFQKFDISSMAYVAYTLNPGSVSVLQEDDLFENRSVVLLNG